MKDKKEFDRICADFIKNTMDFYDIPGIAVGVYCGNDPEASETADTMHGGSPYIFKGAAGYRNYQTKTPVTPDTVFHCTSVSKLFTAAGIMKLTESGRLNLSDRLVDVLPYMYIADKRWENITIKSMLTHTSGLTDVSDYGWENHKTGENALKEYALSPEIAERRLLWAPEQGLFRYSSMAYDLLGLVIAECSGVTFEEFAEREIFKPLGMKNTSFLTFDRINYSRDTKTAGSGSPDVRTDCRRALQAIDRAGLAMPHRKSSDRSIVTEDVYPYTRQHGPSSTLTSTAGDLLKWAAALMGKTELVTEPAYMKSAPLHEESISLMWKEHCGVPDTGEGMGLGWFIRKQKAASADGVRDAHEYILVGHEGSDDGFRTGFWICPQLKIATVLLCNLTDAPLKKLGKKLFEELV